MKTLKKTLSSKSYLSKSQYFSKEVYSPTISEYIPAENINRVLISGGFTYGKFLGNHGIKAGFNKINDLLFNVEVNHIVLLSNKKEILVSAGSITEKSGKILLKLAVKSTDFFKCIGQKDVPEDKFKLFISKSYSDLEVIQSLSNLDFFKHLTPNSENQPIHLSSIPLPAIKFLKE
jgi:hypothetical protein